MHPHKHESELPIAIVGGGIAGIAAGVYLRKAGITDFVIFESSDSPGGTWYDNRYPGAAVDTPSVMYSYSFKPHSWSRPHAGQAEVEDYLNETIQDHELLEHFCLSTEVSSVSWDEDRYCYSLQIVGSPSRDFAFVISAVGLLNVPKYPSWPGMSEFSGNIFHTARWPHEVNLETKRVAVVGTGSTAAQVVPSLAGKVKELFVFQRAPAWVEPKIDRTYTEAEHERMNGHLKQRVERVRCYLASEVKWFGGRILSPNSSVDRKSTQRCREYIETQFANDAELARQLTPSSPYLGKRVVRSSDFYPALRRENTTLVPYAVESMTSTEVVTTEGEAFEVDAVVLATGFQPADYLATLDVIGVGGRSIQEVWNGEPEAFLGIGVPECPNFFMLYGPNTNNYAVIFNLERQAQYAASMIKKTRDRGAKAATVKKSHLRRYNDWLQRRMSGNAFEVGTNYFTSKSGRVVTQFPDGCIAYWLLTKLFRTASYEFWGSTNSPDENARSVRGHDIGSFQKAKHEAA